MKSKKATIIVLTLLLISVSISFIPLTNSSGSGVSMQWSKTFGGTSDDTGSSIVNTIDGGFVIAGTTSSYGAGMSDTYLVKTDSSGNMLWNQTYGGSGVENAYSVIQTSDGGFAVVGNTNSSGAGGYDAYLVKTDSNGIAQWTKTYGGIYDDSGQSVIETRDGGFAIAGSFRTGLYGNGTVKFYLVKTDSSGNIQWTNTYYMYDINSNPTFSGAGTAYSVVQTNDNGFVMVGTSLDPYVGRNVFYIVMTDSVGNLRLSKYYSTGIAKSVVVTADGGLAIAGKTDALNPTLSDVLLVRTDSSGNMLWSKTYGGTAYTADLGNCVIQTADLGFAIAGFNSTVGTVLGDQFYLVRTDSSGNILWNETYGGTGDDEASSLVQSSDGGYAIVGYTDSYGAGAKDVWLIKTTAETLAPSPTVTPTPSPTATFTPTPSPSPTLTATPTPTPTPTASTSASPNLSSSPSYSTSPSTNTQSPAPIATSNPTPTQSSFPSSTSTTQTTTPLVRKSSTSASFLNIPSNSINSQLMAILSTAAAAIGIVSFAIIASTQISGMSQLQIENLPLPKPLQSTLKKFAEKKMESIFQKKKLNAKKRLLVTKRELIALLSTIIAMSFVVGFVMANGLPNVLNPLTFLRFFAGALLSVFITQTLSFFLDIYFSNRSKVQKELNFWRIGSVLFFVSGLILKFPFSSTAKTDTFGSLRYKLSRQKRIDALIATARGLVLSLPIIPFAVLTTSSINELTIVGSAGILTTLTSACFALAPISPSSGKDILDYRKPFATIIAIPVILLLLYYLGWLTFWGYLLIGIVAAALIPILIKTIEQEKRVTSQTDANMWFK